MKFSHFTATILTTTLVSSLAFAWGDLGHQTVGEIAQRHLSPDGKKLVEEILGHGPLAEAATFPDLVRSDSDYSDFSSYHFVEIDPRWGAYENIPVPLKEKRDADSLISGIPKKLFSGFIVEKFSKNQKMDLMRYLVHLVGDVHQPLHVGNGYDRGANWCNVKYKLGNGSLKSTNLHSFWDSGIVEEIFYLQKEKDPSYKMPGWKGFKELADLVLADQKHLNKKQIEATPVLEWYKESQALHSKVYIDVNGPVHPSQREYCQRLVKDENGKPVVDERGVAKTVRASKTADGKENMYALATHEYMKESAEIIKAQILKAGLRLAHIINEMGHRHYLNGTSDYESVKVKELSELLKEFENTQK